MKRKPDAQLDNMCLTVQFYVTVHCCIVLVRHFHELVRLCFPISHLTHCRFEQLGVGNFPP